MVVLLFLTGCGCNSCGKETGPIEVDTIKNDLQGCVSEENFTVNSVATDRAQINEKTCKYDVTATLTAPNAELTREYSLTYNYYEQGGWMMDKCTPINEEQWKAIPKPIELSNDEWVELTWNASEGHGGMKAGSHTYLGYVDTHYLYIWGVELDNLNVEVLENDLENGIYKVELDVRQSNKIAETIENIQIDFVFNPINLMWEFEGESISYSEKFLLDITGEYKRDIKYGDIIGIKKEGNNYYFGGSQIRIEWLSEEYCVIDNAKWLIFENHIEKQGQLSNALYYKIN